MLSDGTKQLVKKYGIDNLQQCIASASEQRRFDQQYLLDFIISNNELIAETRAKTAQYREKLKIQQQLLGQLLNSINYIQDNLQNTQTYEQDDSLNIYFDQINQILKKIPEKTMKFFLQHDCDAFASYIIQNDAFNDYIQNSELFSIEIAQTNVLITLFQSANDIHVKNALVAKIFVNGAQQQRDDVSEQERGQYENDHNYLIPNSLQLQPFMLDTLLTVLGTSTGVTDVFLDNIYDNYANQLIYLYKTRYESKIHDFALENLQIIPRSILDALYRLKYHQVVKIKTQFLENQSEVTEFVRQAANGVATFRMIFGSNDVPGTIHQINDSSIIIYIENITKSNEITPENVLRHFQSMDGSFLSKKTILEAITELKDNIQDIQLIQLIIDTFLSTNTAMHFQASECLRDEDGIIACVLRTP